jgi:hypothetical protein
VTRILITFAITALLAACGTTQAPAMAPDSPATAAAAPAAPATGIQGAVDRFLGQPNDVQRIVDAIEKEGPATIALHLDQAAAYGKSQGDILGPVHGGFFVGVRDKYEALMAACTGPVTVLGHSLGASRAMLFAGLMIANGSMPVRVRVWGCPRPGFSKLSGLIAKCPDALWYRNQSDPVTFVPWRAGLFKHCGEMRQVHAKPVDGDEWAFLRDHHLSQYRLGMVAAAPVG